MEKENSLKVKFNRTFWVNHFKYLLKYREMEKKMQPQITENTVSIFSRVGKMIHEIMPDIEIEVTDKTRFFEDLEFDSISTMQLLVAAEEEFGFDAEDSDESLQAFDTVGDFVRFVEKMVQNLGEKE